MRVRLKHKRLVEILAASPLSQNHWAIKVGLSRGHWSEIVNGKHLYPSAKTRGLMLDALGVPLDELFEIEPGIDPLADTDFRRAIADRFIIDTLLGQGGMGAVYLARDARHGRVVAIKVISPEAVTGIGVTQFEREISTVAQLVHPNILPMFDSGEAAGHPFYVMPWVRDGSLRSRLDRESRLSLSDALLLTRGIAEALHHAHTEHILHCDVKPANVLLHRDHPWVMDFGIARKLHSETFEWPMRQELDVSAGTPAYVSPEQAMGERHLDARSDVYGLACMTFEMLAGRPPFGGTTTQEIVARRFIVPPPPLRDFALDVPAGIQEVLERAMSVPRDRRPGSAVAFVEELEDAARQRSPVLAVVNMAAIATARASRRLRIPTGHPIGGLVRDLFSDIKLTLRGLRRAPAFATIVIVTLGLALGANATMFGVVDRLLFRAPPHIADPEDVTRVHVSRWFTGALRGPVPALSYPAFTDLRDRARAFSAVAAFDEIEVALGRGAESRQLDAVLATGQYFRLLGTRPMLGRFFGEEEARLPTGDPVVVLGHGLWLTHFAGDSGVLGRGITLNGRPYTIIGVAPTGFTGTQLGKVDVWFPITAYAEPDSTGLPGWAQSRGSQWLRVIARLREGVSFSQASSDAIRAYREGHVDHQEYERLAETRLLSLTTRDIASGSREARVSAWLYAMAVIVLMIACANVANLMVARGLARRGEIAVRRALGGSSARLLRQFATESVVLVALGVALGLALARWGAGVMRAMLFEGTSWDSPPLDARVLAATGIAAALAVLIAGIMPLVRGSHTELASAMHGVGRGSVGHRRRLLGALLVVQSGLTMILLVGAGLFVSSLNEIRSLDYGFDPSRLLHVRANIGQADVPETAGFYSRAVERLREIPGVASAGLAIGAPFMSNYSVGVRAPGADSIPRQAGGGPYYFRVSAGAMEALGVRLVRGRFIAAGDDRAGAPPVAVVTERMARTLWPGKDPLGECLVIGRRACAQVVGVVADLHRQQLREPPFFLLFVPLSFSPDEAPQLLLLRTAGDPAAMIGPVRRELLAMNPDLPYVQIEPYEALIAPQAASWRLGATMFTAFGVLSLLIALVGVYGVLSFTVTQRLPELGVRAALGATPRDVLRLVVMGGMATAIIGVALGGLVALAISWRIEPLLFETTARDPLSYAAAALLIATGALGASLVPGLRASRADPLTALRSE